MQTAAEQREETKQNTLHTEQLRNNGEHDSRQKTAANDEASYETNAKQATRRPRQRDPIIERRYSQGHIPMTYMTNGREATATAM